jgi:hypothetical protein
MTLIDVILSRREDVNKTMLTSYIGKIWMAFNTEKIRTLRTMC